MTLRERIRRLICPACIEMESGHARRDRTVSILERSGESLDRITTELSVMRRAWLESPDDLPTALRGVVARKRRRP